VGTLIGYDQEKESEFPPAFQDDEGFSEVAVKSPPPPLEEDVAATTIGEFDAVETFDAGDAIGAVGAVELAEAVGVEGAVVRRVGWGAAGRVRSALSLCVAASLAEARGVRVRQRATWGVVSAQLGSSTRWRREAQSAPNAASNAW
jgi:hypothetical protein